MELRNGDNTTGDVEITDDMIKAGVEILYRCDLRADYAEDIVSLIFEEMTRASPCFRANISEEENNNV